MGEGHVQHLPTITSWPQMSVPSSLSPLLSATKMNGAPRHEQCVASQVPKIVLKAFFAKG